MKRNLSKETRQKLKEELNQVAEKLCMNNIDPLDQRQLEEKYRILSDMLETHWKVSPDTILVVAGNLLGILLILKFEKLDIITTKALSFVLKGRV